MDQDNGRLISTPVFLDALRYDDKALLHKLYTENYPTIMEYVIHNSGNTEDSRDLYQEAFVDVWRNIQTQRFAPQDESEFVAYLIRVSKNKWIDELRKRKKHKTVHWNDGQDIPQDSETYDHEVDNYIRKVQEHYTALGERCRQLLGSFYFERKSLRDIARAFGWTEDSAKSNRYRCLKQLRDLVIKGMNNGKR